MKLATELFEGIQTTIIVYDANTIFIHTKSLNHIKQFL
jgi:hypothetical protein